MLRIAVHLLGAAGLHDLPKVHDGYAVAYMSDNIEVVGDKYIGHLGLTLKVGEQIENLGLNRGVER